MSTESPATNGAVSSFKNFFIADLFIFLVALLTGLSVANYFHYKWYYGGWMMMFGDPPMGSAAYGKFSVLFEKAPYVMAGVTTGVIAGFGYPRLIHILVRGISIIFLFFILAAKNPSYAWGGFLPTAFIAFLASTIVSVVYWHLLNAKWK